MPPDKYGCMLSGGALTHEAVVWCIQQTHWCLAVIFMTEKRIQYYDSMNGSGAACLDVLFRWVET